MLRLAAQRAHASGGAAAAAGAGGAGCRVRVALPLCARARLQSATSLCLTHPLRRHSCPSRGSRSYAPMNSLSLRASKPLLHGGRRHHHDHDDHDDHDHDHDEDAEHDEHDEEKTSKATAKHGKVIDKERMQKECTQITMYGLYSNIGLALFKFIAGVTGNSMAMIADAVHSLSDLVTDGITLWAARLTHKPQDADHPYGHGKFEAVGSLTISVTLAVTAGGIGWQAIESIQTILSGAELAVPTGIALVAAVVSIAVKEVLYHTTLRVGNRWNSKVVKANAWHHRSDSISTLVALVGVVGAMVRVPILDPVAGLFVSGLILKAALELGWDSLRDLTDENVDARLLSSVAGVLQEMRNEGVLSFHRLRGRAMGPFVLMDVHISVEPTMSVSAAHQIAERARIRVRQKLPIISEFLVHVDVAQHARPRTVFESLSDDDDHDKRLQRAQAQARSPNEVHFITADEIQDAVLEHEASRAQTLKLGAEPAAPSAPAGSAQATSAASQSAAASSSSAAVAAAASSEDCHEDLPNNSSDRQANPAAAEGTGAGSNAAAADGADAVPVEAAVGAPAHMDLSLLMRPQHLIERDVQRVLSDPHSSFAPHLLGVSHFTCHWLDQQLTIQLELAFRTDLTISQAARVAEDIEATILQQIHDVNHVDIHLELTHAHIINTQQVKHPLQLTTSPAAPSSAATSTSSL